VFSLKISDGSFINVSRLPHARHVTRSHHKTDSVITTTTNMFYQDRTDNETCSVLKHNCKLYTLSCPHFVCNAVISNSTNQSLNVARWIELAQN
jgi:hypothetical protein